ncbi:CinA family protein [Candidatus Weimeria sp. HCP3S3_B5]|uniref:CinA family protein n=1 Tax=Candidatus Weimeria sp. HCP3S3_B5 TaxID=3438871 RepID=UPI002A9D224C|nr:nicotinamide-nucleotide amidohydrolase family protein [Lachnospiraceae bacterium]
MLYADVLGKLLIAKGITVTTAESATAGMIASCLGDISGISSCMREAYVTYCDEAKERILGVRKETIDTCSVYSHQVAAEMAEGARRVSGADLALSVTGIAGPGGGSPDQPVGLVYIGGSYRDITITRKYIFSGDRKRIRRKAAIEAMRLGISLISR